MRHRRAAAPGLLALLAAWFVAAVITAAPASAHAVLISTDPGDGARLSAPPRQVVLHFDEAVSLGAGYARVLTVEGDRADTGHPAVRGASLVLPLRPNLPDTGYVVTYRVASDDGHPVVGTVSFVVGSGPAVPAPAGAAAGTDPVVAVGLPVARWLGFVGLALSIGVPLLLFGWRGGRRSARLRRLTVVGVVSLAAGAVLSFLLQGPYVAGSGAGAVFRPALLSSTAATEYGVALLLRLLLLGGYAAALLPGWARRPARGRSVVSAGLAAGLVVSFAAVGHPVAGPWPALAVPVAAVHVGAMAVWLGGLAGLLAVVLRSGLAADDATVVLPRFSRVAFAAITALVVTGIVQALREVGSLAALLHTTYGQLVLAKVVLVLAILGAAAVSRRRVRRRFGLQSALSRRRVVAQAFAATSEVDTGRPPADGARQQRTLRRAVLAEFLLGLLVLAVSAVLIGSSPARASYTGPLDVTLLLHGAADGARVRVTLDPARPGPDVLRVSVSDRAGRPLQPVGIRVTVAEVQQRIGPTDVWLQPAGTGRYVSTQLSLPVAGRWTVEVTVGLGGLTAGTARTSMVVR